MKFITNYIFLVFKIFKNIECLQNWYLRTEVIRWEFSGEGKVLNTADVCYNHVWGTVRAGSSRHPCYIIVYHAAIKSPCIIPIIFVSVVLIRLLDLRPTRNKDGALGKNVTFCSNFFDNALHMYIEKIINLDAGA